MKNMKLVIILVAVAVIGAGIAGGAVWYLSKGAAPSPAAAAEAKKKAEEKEAAAHPHKYLTVDKVIIMLRREPGDNQTHYMSADLVVTTDEAKEKEAKEHLPLLRSIAVKTLSSLPLAQAQSMTIDQYAETLNKAFTADYVAEKREKPFSAVMIGKLIIE
nr:flagellar basal body-associated FliL family protein [Rugamonas sp.]